MSPTLAPDRKWLALALLALAQFVVVLDASIVNVALPSIGRDLQFSQENLSWVINAYTLTFGGFLLLGGRMADLLGRRRMFMAGIVLFGVASLLGGFAETRGPADRRPRAPGPRRRAALAGRAVARDRDLQGGRGAQQGARRLGRRGRLRRRRRRAARRHADRVGRLGVGPVRQRPDRRRRRAAGPAPAAREPQRGRAPLRRRRRRLGDGRPVAAGLRARRRPQRGLGLDADDRPDRPVARADRGVRGDRALAAGRRWSRSRASSGTGRSPAST